MENEGLVRGEWGHSEKGKRAEFYHRTDGRRRAFRLGGAGRPGAESEVDEELAFHVEAVAAEMEAEGYGPGVAREEARRRLGDVETTRRQMTRLTQRRRDREGRTMSLDGWRQDVRYAVRFLRKSPA